MNPNILFHIVAALALVGWTLLFTVGYYLAN